VGRGGDKEGQGGGGLKSLNPSLPRSVVRDKNLSPSPSHHFCGARKTCAERNREGLVMRDGEKLSSLLRYVCKWVCNWTNYWIWNSKEISTNWLLIFVRENL